MKHEISFEIKHKNKSGCLFSSQCVKQGVSVLLRAVARLSMSGSNWGCARWFLGGLLQVVIIWKNLGKKINLQSLCSWLLFCQPSIANSTIHNTILCQCFFGCQSTTSSNYTTI